MHPDPEPSAYTCGTCNRRFATQHGMANATRVKCAMCPRHYWEAGRFVDGKTHYAQGVEPGTWGGRPDLAL